MVRVKYRYILAEILTEQHKNKVKIPLREKDLVQAIFSSVETLHGDFGVACIQAGFSIKMFNPATRIFIARVHRRFHSILGSSLPFITTIGKLKLCIRTLHLSGTIRSALKFLIKFDKEKLAEMVQTLELSSEMESELNKVISKCHTRFAKRRLDVE